MKLNLILLFCFSTMIGATGLSQKQIVSVNFKNASIFEVLKTLENKTGVGFIYKTSDFKANKTYSLSMKKVKLGVVLKKIFKDDNVELIFKDDNVVISRIYQVKQENNKLIVSGRVTDAEGQPVVGASVVIKGTTTGTITDNNGNYSVKVSQNSILVFSFIGMKTQEVSVDNKRVINITMQVDDIGLEEVVAVGYGNSKKSDISTSISTVSGIDKISSRPLKSASDFLQGNVPGVTVIQQGGDPTSTPKVIIRGMGSVNNETPLWVVDGVPYDNPSLINQNDIESMSILKDAAAAAIYGAQASSGVIVVTTKSAKEGKQNISFDFMYGMQEAINLPTPLTAKEQSKAYNIATDNSGEPRMQAHDATQNPWGAVNRTNWIDAIFRQAKVLSTNFAISGGNKKGQYLASFNYQNREGVLLGTNSKRFTFRVKSAYNIFDKVKIGQNFSLAYNNAVGANTSSSYSGVIMNAIWMPSAASVYEEDGKTFHGVAPIGSKFAGSYGDIYNPVALLLRPTTKDPVTDFNGNAYITYEPIKGLTFKSSIAVNLFYNNYKKFTPKIPESGRKTEENYLTQIYASKKKWIWDNQVSYKKSFNNHNLDLTAVYSAQKTSFEQDYYLGKDFAKEDSWYQYMRNAGEIKDWEDASGVWDDALTSAIGRVQYNFARKYFLTASIRRDRTSRLYKDNSSDVFPAVSGAWNLASENFMKNVDWLNVFKLRASWGQIGNIASVGYYAYNVPLDSQRPYLGKVPEYLPSYFVSQQSNKDLKWEVSETLDFGTDLLLFNSQLEIIADYYQKKTKGMILENEADPHTGLSDGATSNVGDVKNTGFELFVKYRNSKNKFKYSISANLTTIKNELENLSGYTSSYIAHGANIRASLVPFRSQPGQPIFSYFLIPCEGTFKSQKEIDAHAKNGKLIQPNAKPGDLKFTDVNNDGRIDDKDKKFQGSAFPDFTYSLNFSAKYNQFDLNINFQGVSGCKVFNGYKFTAYNMGEKTYNRDNRVLNAWSTENTNSNIPRLQVKDPNNNFGTNSTWYLEEASYLRLKNITLGYSLPENIMNNFIKGSSLRIYLSAENVFTITDYSGMDPEVGGIGLDTGTYPIARVITGGLSFNF